MFDSDDVDVDLFTPASSTSLASIFKVDKNETTSLKYTPEQSPSQTKIEEKSETAKPTKCIFACASNVYEWANNTYVNKGILGFGIIKNSKNDTHNFVLYNANKTTLSYATFLPSFEVHMKKLSCISYYDNARKYWNIYAKENEIEKILEILKQLNVTVKESEQVNPLTNANSSFDNAAAITIDSSKGKSNDDKSDTDSSINKRCRDSIIKRMATMGHSVLPNTKTNFESTDSSDSNESVGHRRHTKQKPMKSITTHGNYVNNTQVELDGNMCVTKNVGKNELAHVATINIHENPTEIVPCSSLEVVSNKRNEIPTIGMSDVSILISEQRVSNSELRINMNRISDKLDMVLGKFNENANSESSGSNYQNIIIQKLLHEYETKIKYYEECIQTNRKDNKIIKYNQEDKCHDNGESVKEKDMEILQLKDEIKRLNQHCDSCVQKDISYLDEITNLKKEIENKDELLQSLNKKIENTSSNFQMSDDVKNKIKSLMNDTFQSIAANFSNEESYSGSKVMGIVAAVIKKTTIESISNL